MESHCLHFAYSEVGHPGIMTYRRGLLYYIMKNPEQSDLCYNIKDNFFFSEY